MRGIICFLCWAAMPVQAATYICIVNGNPVYTTQKTGDLCSLSDMNGIGEQGKSLFAPAPQVSPDVALPTAHAHALPEHHAQEPDDLYYLWHELEYGSYDKVPIAPALSLPSQPQTIVKPTAVAPPKVSPPKKTPVQAASTVNVPQIPRFNRIGAGMMNRRQILQQELQREQAALNIVREQLAAARKRNDVEAVKRLSLALLDREQNVLALTREIKRAAF